ncbi:MAG: permease prefix domain 1-containing protein, partial [Bryobacteraceae bacterium]
NGESMRKKRGRKPEEEAGSPSLRGWCGARHSQAILALTITPIRASSVGSRRGELATAYRRRVACSKFCLKRKRLPLSWVQGFNNFWRRERLGADIESELLFHVTESAEQLEGEGLSPAEALRQAQLRFGNITLQKERTRDQYLFTRLETLVQDLCYAFRLLRRSPGFLNRSRSISVYWNRSGVSDFQPVGPSSSPPSSRTASRGGVDSRLDLLGDFARQDLIPGLL